MLLRSDRNAEVESTNVMAVWPVLVDIVKI
jgi:hypothetical protein